MIKRADCSKENQEKRKANQHVRESKGTDGPRFTSSAPSSRVTIVRDMTRFLAKCMLAATVLYLGARSYPVAAGNETGGKVHTGASIFREGMLVVSSSCGIAAVEAVMQCTLEETEALGFRQTMDEQSCPEVRIARAR